MDEDRGGFELISSSDDEQETPGPLVGGTSRVNVSLLFSTSLTGFCRMSAGLDAMTVALLLTSAKGLRSAAAITNVRSSGEPATICEY